MVSPNTCPAINSMALKYLSDEELCSLAEIDKARYLVAWRPDQLNTAWPVMDWVVDQDTVWLAKIGMVKQAVTHKALIHSKEKSLV